MKWQRMKHFLVKKIITQVLSLILNLSASSVPVTPTPPFLVRHGMSLPLHVWAGYCWALGSVLRRSSGWTQLCVHLCASRDVRLSTPIVTIDRYVSDLGWRKLFSACRFVSAQDTRQTKCNLFRPADFYLNWPPHAYTHAVDFSPVASCMQSLACNLVPDGVLWLLTHCSGPRLRVNMASLKRLPACLPACLQCPAWAVCLPLALVSESPHQSCPGHLRPRSGAGHGFGLWSCPLTLLWGWWGNADFWAPYSCIWGPWCENAGAAFG